MKSTSLLGSTLQLTLVSLLSQLLYFFYQVILSRMVGTEVLGLIHMVMPVYYTLLSLLTSGFALAVCRLSSEYQSEHNHRALGQLVGHTTQLFSYAFLLFGLLFLLGYRILVEQYFQQSPPLLLLLAIPMLIFFTAQEIFNKHYFYGTNSVHIPAVIQITEQLVRMAAVILLLLIFPHSSPLETVLLILLGMLVSEIYSSLHLTYLRKQQPITFPFTFPTSGNCGHMNQTILRIALPVSLTSFLCQSISTLNSVIIPNLLVRSGLEQTVALQRYGILFGMTLPLLMLPFSLINALSIVLLPYLSRCRVLKQSHPINQALKGSLLAIFLFLAPVTLLIACFGTQLGALFYGQPEAGDFILPLAVGVILSAFEVVAETALNAFNRQTVNACITLLSTLLQVYVTLAYTVSLGLRAYVIGFVLTSALGCLLRGLLLWRLLVKSNVTVPRKAIASVRRTTPDTETETRIPHPPR